MQAIFRGHLNEGAFILENCSGDTEGITFDVLGGVAVTFNSPAFNFNKTFGFATLMELHADETTPIVSEGQGIVSIQVYNAASQPKNRFSFKILINYEA